MSTFGPLRYITTGFTSGLAMDIDWSFAISRSVNASATQGQTTIDESLAVGKYRVWLMAQGGLGEGYCGTGGMGYWDFTLTAGQTVQAIVDGVPEVRLARGAGLFFVIYDAPGGSNKRYVWAGGGGGCPAAGCGGGGGVAKTWTTIPRTQVISGFDDLQAYSNGGDIIAANGGTAGKGNQDARTGYTRPTAGYALSCQPIGTNTPVPVEFICHEDALPGEQVNEFIPHRANRYGESSSVPFPYTDGVPCYIITKFRI